MVVVIVNQIVMIKLRPVSTRRMGESTAEGERRGTVSSG